MEQMGTVTSRTGHLGWLVRVGCIHAVTCAPAPCPLLFIFTPLSAEVALAAGVHMRDGTLVVCWLPMNCQSRGEGRLEDTKVRRAPSPPPARFQYVQDPRPGSQAYPLGANRRDSALRHAPMLHLPRLGPKKRGSRGATEGQGLAECTTLLRCAIAEQSRFQLTRPC